MPTEQGRKRWKGKRWRRQRWKKGVDIKEAKATSQEEVRDTAKQKETEEEQREDQREDVLYAVAITIKRIAQPREEEER